MSKRLRLQDAELLRSERGLLRSKMLNLLCTFGAIGLLIFTGSSLTISLLAGVAIHDSPITPFLLNAALIVLGWRRSKDVARAIVAREQAEARAVTEAAHDYLTGLANRRHFASKVEDALAAGSPSALILFDLDFFKKVNDLHGHAAGDELLVQIASWLRSTLPPDSVGARLGGDEFGVLLPAAFLPHAVDSFCLDIRSRLSSPFHLRTTVASVSASIGVATLSADVPDAETAIRRADLAMYEAKANGRNGICAFDAQIEERVRARNLLEADIRRGIERGEFVPFYQPLVDLRSSKIVGFEVLARWLHPERGLLEPAEFIELAEATALISGLSFSVMEQAFREARAWPPELRISVNISPIQFRDPLLAQHILKLLTATGFPGQRLEIELTESAILDDHNAANDTIQSLKNNGITIALDDFGTGYASLAQLTSMPFDRIKIDKSFVSGVLSSSHSKAIVDAITGLGSSLRVPITAEGVESDEVRQHLQDLGCSTAQGWLFGRATDAGDVDEILRRLPLESSTLSRILPISLATATPRPEQAPDTRGRAANGRR